MVGFVGIPQHVDGAQEDATVVNIHLPRVFVCTEIKDPNNDSDAFKGWRLSMIKLAFLSLLWLWLWLWLWL